MHSHIWVLNKKKIETWQREADALSLKEALQDVVSSLLNGRRVRQHYPSKGIIVIVVELADEQEIASEVLPEVFLRLACKHFHFTPCEANTMIVMMDETDNEVIGDKLNVSAGTVKKHKEHIYTKLKVHDCGAAIAIIKEKAKEIMDNTSAG